mmetsp:Transcript_128113/g.323441  ORF Transcript_128113/g.323441 Transcript_128113/m.323441 type:complete len:265 (-) Transcript_128113:119-913(-)
MEFVTYSVQKAVESPCATWSRADGLFEPMEQLPGPRNPPTGTFIDGDLPILLVREVHRGVEQHRSAAINGPTLVMFDVAHFVRASLLTRGERDCFLGPRVESTILLPPQHELRREPPAVAPPISLPHVVPQLAGLSQGAVPVAAAAAVHHQVVIGVVPGAPSNPSVDERKGLYLRRFHHRIKQRAVGTHIDHDLKPGPVACDEAQQLNCLLDATRIACRGLAVDRRIHLARSPFCLLLDLDQRSRRGSVASSAVCKYASEQQTW